MSILDDFRMWDEAGEKQKRKNDPNRIEPVLADMPRWEFALLARKDPLAEGIKWLEEHGFHQLSIRVKSELNNDTWERVFQKDDYRVSIHVSPGEDMWSAVLYADKVYRGEGLSPFKALDDLSGKASLTKILDRTL